MDTKWDNVIRQWPMMKTFTFIFHCRYIYFTSFSFRWKTNRIYLSICLYTSCSVEGNRIKLYLHTGSLFSVSNVCNVLHVTSHQFVDRKQNEILSLKNDKKWRCTQRKRHQQQIYTIIYSTIYLHVFILLWKKKKTKCSVVGSRQSAVGIKHEIVVVYT